MNRRYSEAACVPTRTVAGFTGLDKVKLVGHCLQQYDQVWCFADDMRGLVIDDELAVAMSDR